MKTLKDILLTAHTKKCEYMSGKTLDFLVQTHNLHLLKHFIIPQIRKYIMSITPSKRDAQELLITFSNYPACVEFNKFHATKLLHTIQNNTMLQEKINLSSYTKIRGYMPKNRLELYTIESIRTSEMHENAEGNFINHATDPKLHAIFEDIRNIIHLHHRHTQNLCMQEEHAPNTYNIADKAYKNTALTPNRQRK